MGKKHGKFNNRGHRKHRRNPVVVKRKNKNKGIFLTGDNDMSVNQIDDLTGGGGVGGNSPNDITTPHNTGRRATGFNLAGTLAALVAPAEPDYWEAEIEVIPSCGTAPKSLPVTVGPVAQAKFTALMKEYPRIEWLAYLVGDPATRHITDIVIPEQEVTAVNVFVGNQGVTEQTIGVIHSHHGMGNGFSGTDHEYINGNHDISLCIANNGIAGQVRIPTQCGKFVIVDADVSIPVEGFDETPFITEAKKLIKPKTFTYPQNNFTGVGGGYRGRGHQLGLEDDVNDFPINAENIGVNDDDFGVTLGIADLSDAFQKDVETMPDSFAIIDLVGFKELLSEVINPARNYDRFADMFNSYLSAHTLYIDEPEDFFNPAVELLDELDVNFETISQYEKNFIIDLWKSLKVAVELLIEDAEEKGELVKTDSLPTDEELWFTPDDNTLPDTTLGQSNDDAEFTDTFEHPEFCNCVKCRDARAAEGNTRTGVSGHLESCNCIDCRDIRLGNAWDATDKSEAGDGTEDGASCPVDVDEGDELPSDNMWDTSGSKNGETEH